MSLVLRTTALDKHYGRIHAVRSLDLEIPKGTVFGMLGPNGSGKTTTLGMVLGVVNSTSGSYVWFDGEDPVHARKRIGAILEKPTFYPTLTAMQNLAIVARIKECGMSRADEVLKMVGLYERRNDSFKGYSLGMKQRLAIASAMLNDPEVLVLDEPTNGLDPMGIAEMRNLIKDIAAMNKTIILASHLLDEVQKVCSDYAILRTGKLIHQGKVEEDLNGSVVVELAALHSEKLRILLNESSHVLSAEFNEGLFLVKLNEGVSAESLNKYLFEQDVVLSHLRTRKRSLEEQFLEIVNRSA